MTDKRSQKYALRRYVCIANEDNFCEMARPHCEHCRVAKQFEEEYELQIDPSSKRKTIIRKVNKV